MDNKCSNLDQTVAKMEIPTLSITEIRQKFENEAQIIQEAQMKLYQ